MQKLRIIENILYAWCGLQTLADPCVL